MAGKWRWEGEEWADVLEWPAGADSICADRGSRISHVEIERGDACGLLRCDVDLPSCLAMCSIEDRPGSRPASANVGLFSGGAEMSEMPHVLRHCCLH